MKKALTLSLIMILALSSFAVFADEVTQTEGPRVDSFSEEFKIEMNELRMEMQEARENEDTEKVEELKVEIKALFEEYGYIFKGRVEHEAFSEEFKAEMKTLRTEMQEAREAEDTDTIEELKEEIKALFEEYGYTPRDLFRKDMQHIRGDMRDDYKEGDVEGFRQNSEKLINRMQARNQMLQNRLENR